MEYQSLTAEERELVIAEALHSRELEHFHYQLNCDCYTQQLKHASVKDLPEVWPEEIAKLANASRDEIIARVSASKQQDLALKLRERDRLCRLLRSELHERDNVERIYAGLLTQIPPERVAAALEAARTKRTAETAALQP